MHVWPIYTPMLLYMCIHMIHTYEMTCLIDATYYKCYHASCFPMEGYGVRQRTPADALRVP